MKVAKSSMTAIIALGALLLAAQSAVAGCGPDGLDGASLKPMVYRPDEAGGWLRTNFFGPFNTAAITGLWRVNFTAQGNTGPNAPPNALPIPDGAPVDAAFATWHDDGTELMNSARAPASGSFCMGVWKQVSRDSYRLNHWAISWIPDYHPGGTQSWSELPGGVDEAFAALGPTNIEEIVTLKNHGNQYTGVFRITQYVNDGKSKPVTDITGAPVAFVIVGTISATRINP
jgi:hypothetical protein